MDGNSKITCFEDISSIGGQSLGFRGEALASAAEMSGKLLVSTRVEGEATAVTLKMSRQGTMEKYGSLFQSYAWTELISMSCPAKTAFRIRWVRLSGLLSSSRLFPSVGSLR